MALADVLKGFFGWGSTGKNAKEDAERIAQASANLDIDAAIAGHENWKHRLTAYLEGVSSEKFVAEEICFDDRCDLGKWLHGTGHAKLGQFAGFTALVQHHKMFHYAASNVVALSQAGKPDEAEKILAGQFSKHSKDVVEGLQGLKSAARQVRSK